MKAYGYSKKDLQTCLYGCCGCKKNPNLCGKRTNVKPYDKRAKKTARQINKTLTKEV